MVCIITERGAPKAQGVTVLKGRVYAMMEVMLKMSVALRKQPSVSILVECSLENESQVIRLPVAQQGLGECG